MQKDTTVFHKGEMQTVIALGTVAYFQGYEHYETALWRKSLGRSATGTDAQPAKLGYCL